MERTTDIITINSIGQIPTLESIREIPRERTLKLVFDSLTNNQRETIGQKLRTELDGFSVGIHTREPVISIAKLITDKEVEDNQDFFEQCAKDYRKLGEELIFKLADKLNTIINSDHPLATFNKFRANDQQIGKVENWKYFLHGFHCGFHNEKTGQYIEVPLIFGLEFGDLDPYFFTQFIKSTPNYKPLPVNIYENYADGERINNKMLSLGKFEKINSNVGNHAGIVVTDREKVEIKSYRELNELYKKEDKELSKN